MIVVVVVIIIIIGIGVKIIRRLIVDEGGVQYLWRKTSI